MYAKYVRVHGYVRVCMWLCVHTPAVEPVDHLLGIGVFVRIKDEIVDIRRPLRVEIYRAPAWLCDS